MNIAVVNSAQDLGFAVERRRGYRGEQRIVDSLADHDSENMDRAVDLSVVVPLYNEEPNVGPLAEWTLESLVEYRGRFELILVDSGSVDGTWKEICKAVQYPAVRGLRLAQNLGQTAAMTAGFDSAVGETVVSLDGDLQNDPGDILALLDKLNEGYDLVCGWRRRRQDSIVRVFPSWCANRIIGWITGVHIKDNGCSLKAYRLELLKRLALYSDQHRFIAALAAGSGARIAQLPVRHHPRRYGKSKYGLSRTFAVLLDLITLKTVTAFGTRPLAGFGTAALGAVAVSASFTLAWTVAMAGFTPAKAYALVFPGAALLWLGAAFYLVMLGCIAEVALRTDSEQRWRAPVVREVE
jgi:hypothetical protein